MTKTYIKTIAFLIKCLRVDIKIYKEVQGIPININRVVLYKSSLIELLEYTSDANLYILITKECADLLIKTIDEANKLKRAAAAKALESPTGEPGYELTSDSEDASQEGVAAI